MCVIGTVSYLCRIGIWPHTHLPLLVCLAKNVFAEPKMCKFLTSLLLFLLPVLSGTGTIDAIPFFCGGRGNRNRNWNQNFSKVGTGTATNHYGSHNNEELKYYKKK
jgi:hypothetical protein